MVVERCGASLPLKIDMQIAEHCLTRTRSGVRFTGKANVTHSIGCILHLRQVHSIHIKKEIASMSNHMWVRDRFFPSPYAHATRASLATVFSVGRLVCCGIGRESMWKLRPFNNPQLTRDLNAVCRRVNEVRPRLPDGRLLILHAPSSPFG